MCLLKVKEEQEYSVPARVRSSKWTSTNSASPPRTSYYSTARVIENRRVSGAALPLPPPPPQSYYRESRTEYKQSETPVFPSDGQSYAATDSKHTSGMSRVPSATTRSHYVEVEHHDDSTSSSSSIASRDDVRSRTTRQSSKTANTRNTRQTSISRATAPTSQYSEYEREREVRRERTYSRPSNAPLSESRSRDIYDPRMSSGSYGRRSQQYYR